MKLAIVESPFGTRPDGTRCSPQELAENKAYLNACLRDCLRRGELPYASHSYLPNVLDDATPAEREQGMEVGFAWAAAAAMARAYSETHAGPGDPEVEVVIAVYVDRGVTSGMVKGIGKHRANGLEVVERRLGGGWAK